MHKFKIRALLSTLLLAIPSLGTAQTEVSPHFNDVSYTPAPPLSVSGGQGVSAPFAGVSRGTVLVAGGCNFPDTPAADGGKKVFYDRIYALPLNKENAAWRKVGQLPHALAYGASVTTPEGVVCLGGTDAGGKSRREAFLLRVSGDIVLTEALPPLPIAMDQMAAAYGDGCVYVAGGQTDGQPTHKAFRLRLSNASRGWEVLPDVPGSGRVQPCAVVQNGALGPLFYLFGGYDPTTNQIAGNGAFYNPRTGKWGETSPIQLTGAPQPLALVGAQAVTSGCGAVIFLGGVDRNVFQEAIRRSNLLAAAPTDSLQAAQQAYMRQPAAWYHFRTALLAYLTVTDAWTEGYASPLNARAGAAVVAYRDAAGQAHWLEICGEEKPGVRATDVTDVRMTYTAHFGVLNWTVLIVYLVGMLALGFYFMQRQKGGEDFFKGGGRIPWWAAGISIFATMLSAITYMSIPAKAYATDWTYYPMQVCILLISFPVIKYYLPFFRRLNVTSAYEYLERRFNYAARLVASLLFIVFMVARMALVLFLPSLAMTAVTGIDIYICIVLMAVITIVYCTMGGMEAVVWGDVVQGIILVGGALLAAGYLIAGTDGGASGFLHIACDNDKFRLFDWSLDWRSATFWVVILGGLANNLISYTSDQTVIQRYLTTKDERGAARGILTNGLMSVFVTIAFFCIGTGLYTFFKTHPAAMDMTMEKTDAIFPFFMMSQLPAGIAGLLIAAVFAATMSTIASNINSISTAFTVDMYRKARPATSDKHQLRVARYAGIVSGVLGMGIALVMATVDIQSLLDYFNTILGLLSGGIGALFLMGIFFPRIGSGPAICGFLAGTLTVIGLNFFTAVNFLLFGFTSIVVSLAVALLLSLVWKGRAVQPGLTWSTLDKA